MMQLPESMTSIFAGAFPFGAAASELWHSSTWLGSALLDPITRSLVHFLWQGTLIALITAGALFVLRRRDARERYAVACMGLLTMGLTPILTASYLAEPARTVVSPTAPTTPGETIITTAAGASSAPLGVAARTADEWSISGLETHSATIFAVWLLGILAMICMHVGGFQRLRRMRSHGKRVEEAHAETLLRLQARLGIQRSVDFLESPVIQSPMAMGWLKPVILIPSNALFGLSPQQLEAVLAHELGHIRRHDYLVNLGQILLETLLFYHPAVWWLSHRVRVEREHCCDDIAVSLDNNPAIFARALANLETLRPKTPALALGVDGHGSLLSRIQRLAKGDHSRRRSQGMGSSLLAIAIASTVAVCGTALMVGCPINQLDAAELLEPMADSELEGLDGSDLEEEQSELEELDGSDLEEEQSDLEEEQSDLEEGQEGQLEDEDFATENDEDYDEGESERDQDHDTEHDHKHDHHFEHARDFEHDRNSAHYAGKHGRDYDKAWREKRAVELRAWAEGTPWSTLDTVQLEELAGQGFKGDTFPALADAGLQPDTNQLMDLARHGIDAPDVRAAATAFPELTVDQLLQLTRSGVDADDLLELQNAGYGHLSADEVAKLARHGVDGDDLRDLKQAGQGDLSIEQVVRLAQHGLDGDDILELQNAGFGELSLEQLIELSRHGIDGDDIAELTAAGLDGLPLEKVIEMARHGLDGEDFQELRDAGYPDLTLEQAMALTRHGVDGDDIQELSQAGITGLSVDEVLELARHGVDGDDIEELREEGASIENVEQIVELVRSGRLN